MADFIPELQFNGPLISGPISILSNGTALKTRPRINIVEGSNVTIDVVDDATNYKTDITITATGGGGSGAGTVTSVDLSGGTTGMSFSGGPITSSGTITMDGTLGVPNGGTGRVTFTSGYLKADATTAFTTVSNIPGTDISGNISGNASSITSVLPISLGGTNSTTASDARTSLGLGAVATENIVPIAKGGTGSTTASDARTAFDVPTKAGSGATGTWGISISGNASTVTNGIYTSSTYSDPSWLTSLAGSKVSGNISGNAANVTGVVQIANGGTGATTAAAALNALGGYSNTNPAGYTANTGTVTSVAGNGSVNGITLTGTVTTSGNITLGGALSGVSLSSQVTGTLPIANGGTGGTTAGAARTNLEAAWSGAVLDKNNNLSDLTNTATALTNLGAYPASNPSGYTSNTGTVTSVGVTAGTGISVSGSPITGSGSITVTNSAPLPTGGAKYSRLGKNSTTNYDAGWYGPYEVNVKDYGATGDGTTSDITAINNAISAVKAGSSGTGDGVTEIVVVYGGSGYTSVPTVSVSGGSSFSGTAIVRDQMVIAVVVSAGGSGFSGSSVVTFSGGGGSGASAFAIVGKGGRLVFPPGEYSIPYGVTFDGLHNVMIEATGATFLRDTTSTQPGIWINGTCRRTTLRGAFLKGNSSDRNGTYGVGILVQGDDISIIGCEVTKWPNFAIQGYADTSAESRYFAGPLIQNCSIFNTYADGIHIGHGFIQPKIIGNTIDETEEEDGIAFFNDFKNNLVCRDVLIANNVLRNVRWRGILTSGFLNGNVVCNLIDGTASYGIGNDDVSTSIGSITLSLTSGSITATATAGSPLIAAYISGTGLSLPAVITNVSGSTVTLSQAANATGSYSFNMYSGVFNLNVGSNTILNVGSVTKNGSTSGNLHGIYMLRGAKAQVSNNLVVGVGSGGYAVKVDDFVDIYVTANGGYDMASGYLTFSAGANVYGTRALYDDSGALKYRGTSATVTTLAPA